MSRRRQTTSWIHRNSRYIIAAIAVLGILNTGYITATKLFGGEAACPTKGCEQVLSSGYAYVLGLPLSLFGLLAYIAMLVFALAPLAIKDDEKSKGPSRLQNTTWLLLFIGSTAMMIFSGYLMYIMATEFVAKYGPSSVCIYCIASALFATSLFVLTLVGHAWEDIGQLFLTGFLVGMVVLIGALGVYADVGVPSAETTPGPGQATPVTTASGPAEIGLARHLKEIGAKMYGAYWCPHCHDQKQLFGQPAFRDILYIECAPDGQNSQTATCEQIVPTVRQQTGKDFGFPTWEINGKFYVGVQDLEALANASGYNGPRNFQNRL
jgi:uncharacterized membrane protein/glutaredoxin